MRCAICLSVAWVACSLSYADTQNEGEPPAVDERPILARPDSPDASDALAPAPWSVIGDWHVTNPDWNFAPNNTDVLTLHEDGTHSVAHGSTGRWILTAEQGTPVLVLRWDQFGTESMSMIALDHFRGQKRPNRIIDMRRVTEE